MKIHLKTKTYLRNAYPILLIASLISVSPDATHAAARLILPFDLSSADQDTVLFTGAGSHITTELTTQIAEIYRSDIYYVTSGDGTDLPSKVLCFSPVTSRSTTLLASSTDQFLALKVMNRALWISHINGSLWSYDGNTLRGLTGAPFNSTNSVCVMAELNRRMYFGTRAGSIYESLDGSNYELRTIITVGKPITALKSWNGCLYGGDCEDYSYSAKLFRSSNGTGWSIIGTFPTYLFCGFLETPGRLYVVSLENAGWASLRVRATTDGADWTSVFYTDTEGKHLSGMPTFFSQTGRSYFPSWWFDIYPSKVPRLFPVYDGVVESRVILRHGFNSFVELDGAMYGIGAQNPKDGGSSPHVISRLGKYEFGRLDLIKAVKPAFHDLSLGTNYQLQVSADMFTWTNSGAPFSPTNTNMIYPQYWDVDNWGKLFFRLQVVP